MARIPFRKAVLSGVAALTLGVFAAPGTDEPLSNQRGNAPAAEQSYERFATEGRALDREYKEIEFEERSLAAAQQALTTQQGDVAAQVRAIGDMNRSLQQRIATRTERVDRFHSDLMADRNLSEADLNALYTGPFAGTYYAHYYSETMAYRDECTRDVNCMEQRENNEVERKLVNIGATSGILFGGALAGMFGLSAAGNLRRRRQQEKHVDTIDDIRKTISPRK